MTITEAESAPLVAVVGATGTQGGSVIKALSESNKPYRIRGFTRDVTKAAAEALKKQGVEMVAVNLVVENKEAVFKAFAGADYAFLVTNFLEHMNGEKELSEGKMLIDAAKAAGVKGIIWSGLPYIKKISGGKYTHVVEFDSKALVTEYGRASGVPFVDVQAGCYASNFNSIHFRLLAKQSDGTYALSWPVRPTTVISIIDMENDYGLYVRRALEMPVFPDGSVVYTTSEDITVEEIAHQISEVTGKKVVFKQITTEEATKGFLSLGRSHAAVTNIVECFLFFDDFGYYGGQPSASREGLARPTRTFTEFVKDADWSKVLA